MATKREIRSYAEKHGISREEAKQHFINQAIDRNNMPSFLVRLNVDKDFNITYDDTDLLDNQKGFANKCIEQLKDEAKKNIKDPLKAFGIVFWGDSKDFGANLSEAKEDADLDAHWTEHKDMFFSTFWETTNQSVELSAEHCDQVVSGTPVAPIGAKLGNRNNYSNFSISVAYMRHFSKFTKQQIGDLCPPECDPNHKQYSEKFIPKVKQALSKFNIEIECDWRPGYVLTKFKEAA